MIRNTWREFGLLGKLGILIVGMMLLWVAVYAITALLATSGSAGGVS